MGDCQRCEMALRGLAKDLHAMACAIEEELDGQRVPCTGVGEQADVLADSEATPYATRLMDCEDPEWQEAVSVLCLAEDRLGPCEIEP